MNTLHKEIRIPSSLEHLNKVEKFVEEICEAYYVTNSYFGNILLAIEEAVKNAIIHGNKKSESKEVAITFQSRAEGLSFTIADEGEGFNYMTVRDPLDPDEKAAENAGKGIFLIRSLADITRYNHKGTRLEMVFTINSLNREISLRRIDKLSTYFATLKTAVE